MKFSLILPTLTRTTEVGGVLESLLTQEHKDFEIIIVDQNKDGRLESIIRKYQSSLQIIHIFSEPGLSKARNAGLARITGDLVAFPDDDCLYPATLLSSVNSYFENTKAYDGLLVQMKDSNGKESTALSKMKSASISPLDVFTTASISIFVRRDVIRKIEKFDEGMGLGAGTIFKGGEDYDFVLHALKHGVSFYYENSIEVLHPIVVPDIDNGSLEVKTKYYQRITDAGTSDFLLLKRYFPFLQRLRILINNFLGLFYYGIFGNKRQYLLHYYRCKGFLISIRHLKSI